LFQQHTSSEVVSSTQEEKRGRLGTETIVKRWEKSRRRGRRKGYEEREKMGRRREKERMRTTDFDGFGLIFCSFDGVIDHFEMLNSEGDTPENPIVVDIEGVYAKKFLCHLAPRIRREAPPHAFLHDQLDF
jgi:hypothetical protein